MMPLAKALVLGFALMAVAAATTYAQQGEIGTRQLIGKKVSDVEGQALGEIQDVVIDLQGPKVYALLLGIGGKLGFGATQYAFPISDLQPGKDGNRLVLNVEKQKLENGEGFAKGQWPEIDRELWGREGGQAGAGASKEQGMTLLRVGKLKGEKLQDRSGQEVGEVKDILVNLDSGQVGDIVVDVEGAGEARVPARTLIRGIGDRLVLTLSAKELRSQAGQAKK